MTHFCEKWGRKRGSGERYLCSTDVSWQFILIVTPIALIQTAAILEKHCNEGFELLSAMKQAWQNNGDGNMHGAGLCSLHFTLTNPSSLDINENNRAYSETDAPSPIICQALFTISAFWLVFIFNFSLIECFLFIGLQKKSLRLSAFFNLVCSCQLHYYTHNHRYRRTNADTKIIALLWGDNSDYDRVHIWPTTNPNISCVL